MDLLNLEQYEQHFRGFGLRDCAVRSRDIYYFVLFQDWPDDKPRPFDEELETRLVPMFRAKDEKWSHSVLTGFGGLMACAARHPMSQCVTVDLSGQVYVIGSGVDEIEQKIPGGLGKGPSRGAVTRGPIRDFVCEAYHEE
ncbi:hypothetical protein ACKZDW_10575 [Ralstonia syzygii subsp. celebesensis]|uniref:Uncharacterized protein n=2 Tax=Ralstonia syzygii TaxID=28097 RepID=A0A1U9VEH3_9RALS|nr:hypothetical protein [Ralstonia syzygii]AQW29079.1 hypothetical protein B0B51_02955 [blood disease bacterium A2-HR MARDI]QQV54379.1 hypothetical protein JK151_09165 [Ralstonia syzygii subsp. celebesensis]